MIDKKINIFVKKIVQIKEKEIIKILTKIKFKFTGNRGEKNWRTNTIKIRICEKNECELITKSCHYVLC